MILGFNSSQRGQSLVEAVVVIGMVILMVGGLIVGTTVSIRASESGKFRSQAVKYTQEGIEYARNLRNLGWADFRAKTGDWCLDKAKVLTPANAGTCPINVDTIFSRKLSLSWSDPRMSVTVTVNWNDGSGEHVSQATTYFTEWR